MSRDPHACVGNCNRKYREAWDAHDTALNSWAAAAERAILHATRQAPTAAGVPTAHQLTGRQIDALNLPDRPEQPDVPYNAGDPIWCGRCRPQIRKALIEVDRLAALLDQWSDGHRGATSGEKVSRSTAPSSPSPIANILDSLYGEVTDMENEWRELRAYAPVRRGSGRGTHHRMLAIAFIAEHLTDIFLSADHVVFCQRVLRWEQLLLGMTRSDPVVRRRSGRCPRCQLVNVLQTRDDGYTVCKDCGWLMNEDEYQAKVVGAADHVVIEDSRAART
jgi:hypothetical protein